MPDSSVVMKKNHLSNAKLNEEIRESAAKLGYKLIEVELTQVTISTMAKMWQKLLPRL